MKKVRNFFNCICNILFSYSEERRKKILESIACRFALLILCAALGSWFLFLFRTDCLGINDCLKSVLSVCGESKLMDNLSILILGLPVFIVLWWYRTNDTKKTLIQNDFFNGLANLASNNPLKIDIGLMTLKELSKNYKAYNNEIKLAFIRRLKTKPNYDYKAATANKSRLAYAQHIILWLGKNGYLRKEENLDLKGVNLDYQEFRIFFEKNNESYKLKSESKEYLKDFLKFFFNHKSIDDKLDFYFNVYGTSNIICFLGDIDYIKAKTAYTDVKRIPNIILENNYFHNPYIIDSELPELLNKEDQNYLFSSYAKVIREDFNDYLYQK